MNISLPASLKAYVDERVAEGDYGTGSEYIRELIRRDRDREHLRGLLLDGAASPLGATADDGWYEALRRRARQSDTT